MCVMYRALEQSLLKAVSHGRSSASFKGTEPPSVAQSQAPAEAGLLRVGGSPTWAAFALLSTASTFFFWRAVYLLKPLVGTKCRWDEVWTLSARRAVFGGLWSRWRGSLKVGAAGVKLGFSIISAKGGLWLQTSQSEVREWSRFEKPLALGSPPPLKSASVQQQNSHTGGVWSPRCWWSAVAAVWRWVWNLVPASKWHCFNYSQSNLAILSFPPPAPPPSHSSVHLATASPARPPPFSSCSSRAASTFHSGTPN